MRICQQSDVNKRFRLGRIFLKGFVLSTGVGFGYLHKHKMNVDQFDSKEITLEEIIEKVRTNLTLTCANSLHISEEETMIFDAHKTLLEDATFIEGIRTLLEEGHSLDQAILENGKNRAVSFINMEDQNLRHIAEDIMDITYQMLDVIHDKKNEKKLKEPVVFYAENILPSKLLNLIEKYKVSAILCKNNSELSHSAIIARAAQIPMISKVNLSLPDDTPLIVDADSNKITVNPDYEQLLITNARSRRNFVDFTHFPIEVKINAGSLKELLKINKTGRSIGLYRSEYLYLQKEKLPEDREVFLHVKTLFDSFTGTSFDYRLPDFGRDKLPSYLENHTGSNGISYLLEEKRILTQQIEAIKASGYRDNIRILLPYVQSEAQILEMKEMLKPFAFAVGAMIETYMETDILESIISKSAFINIGTNDLICSISGNERATYMTANAADMEKMFVYIEKICEIARQYGIKTCICGEIASSPKYKDRIISTKIDGISVSYFHILNK